VKTTWVKVCGFISREEHARVASTAALRSISVRAIVAYGVRLVLETSAEPAEVSKDVPVKVCGFVGKREHGQLLKHAEECGSNRYALVALGVRLALDKLGDRSADLPADLKLPADSRTPRREVA